VPVGGIFDVTDEVIDKRPSAEGSETSQLKREIGDKQCGSQFEEPL
jgi:hypothetical protein